MWLATGRGKLSGLLGGRPVAIHSSGQPVFSFSHIEGITLSAGKEVDEVKTLMWRHLYLVFTYIYYLLIEKDMCSHQNISIKFQCVCMCLSSRDYFIFLIRVFPFFSHFLCYSYFGTFLHTWFLSLLFSYLFGYSVQVSLNIVFFHLDFL